MTSAAEAIDQGAASPLLSPVLAPWPDRPSSLRAQLNLVLELAITSFKLKYAASVLGYIWSLARPLMLFGLMYIVFAFFLLRHRITPQENFAAQLLVGIVCWYFFNEATHSALTAVVSNGDMLRKAYLPRWILVVAALMTSTMTLAVNMTLLLILGVIFHWYHVGWQTLLVIPLLLELFLFALGVGLILAAIFVYFRDFGHIWDVLLLFFFYASGIVFPIFTLVPRQYLKFMALNPIAQTVEDVRRALVTAAIPWSTSVLGPRVLLPIGFVVLLLPFGAWIFRRLGPRFAERL